jgi:hypothetical protein
VSIRLRIAGRGFDEMMHSCCATASHSCHVAKLRTLLVAPAIATGGSMVRAERSGHIRGKTCEQIHGSTQTVKRATPLQGRTPTKGQNAKSHGLCLRLRARQNRPGHCAQFTIGGPPCRSGETTANILARRISREPIMDIGAQV